MKTTLRFVGHTGTVARRALFFVAISALAMPAIAQQNAHVGDAPAVAPPLATDVSAKLNHRAVEHAVRKVADWELHRSQPYFDQDWTFAALYAGFMAVPDAAGGNIYRDAMLQMGKKFQWQLGPRLSHADDHAIGQTYLALYQQFHDPVMLTPTRERMDAMIQLPDEMDHPLWWWCDALFMAPPVLARLSAITDDRKYLDFMDREWWITSNLLYDPKTHLFFRDATFLNKREANGNGLFWSRGNGWVMAGLVRVLEEMPRDYPSRGKYVAQLQEMAAEIASMQGSDGLWRPGLLDATAYPLPEDSGSAFFIYALAYGVNHGILDRVRYLPVIEKGWAGLVSHIYADGRFGCIQPSGRLPATTQPMRVTSSAPGPFCLPGRRSTAWRDDDQKTREGGVKLARVWKAAFLVLASSAAFGQVLTVMNPLDVDRAQEVVEVPLQQVLDHLHAAPAQAESIVAKDAATGRTLPDQVFAGTYGSAPDKLLVLVQLGARNSERILFRLNPEAAKTEPLVFGREAPERKDDFAWENQEVAFRIYGPALEATGEITSGIDVWSKRIPNFVIDSFYKRDAEGARTHNSSLSYHIDNGQGLDSYEVGSSRGCGGTAVFVWDKLIVSKNYTKLHVLGNGPIRFSFEVTYAPWNANGITVTETKRITLDAGTHMNKIQSTYTFAGERLLS